jgi:hypothetical protein
VILLQLWKKWMLGWVFFSLLLYAIFRLTYVPPKPGWFNFESLAFIGMLAVAVPAGAVLSALAVRIFWARKR